ncbi:hypothetical protein ABT336_13310 [Micromonospora sp. NPDC000207]|uniref:hypothetical protein n=1 Tax=Micromonospora sp. NPDC000207 TaxID=3154246 RepID=UPI00332B5BC6
MAVEPIATFTRNHPVSGEKQTRLAYSPDERVHLRADGWLEQPRRKQTSTDQNADDASSRTAKKSTASGSTTSTSS